jgi:hypothetical protein
VEKKEKDDDDRNRKAQQPEQDVAHDVSPEFSAQETSRFRSRSILANSLGAYMTHWFQTVWALEMEPLDA